MINQWLFRRLRLRYQDIHIHRTVKIHKKTKIHLEKGVRIRDRCNLQGIIRLEKKVQLQKDITLEGNVTIGTGSVINKNCEFVGNIHLGNYCAIARNVSLQETNHPTYQASMQVKFYKELFGSGLKRVSKGPIIVGSDVWIGMRAIILSGVNVGHGAVIGAGSVVTSNIEPYSIVVGVPAKRVKFRFSKAVRKALLELAWWEWDEEKIIKNQELFEANLIKDSALLSEVKI